jgi:hypothetical protein
MSPRISLYPRFPRDLAAVQAIASELSPRNSEIQLLIYVAAGVNIFRQFMTELGVGVTNNWTIAVARQDFRQAIGCSPIIRFLSELALPSYQTYADIAWMRGRGSPEESYQRRLSR